MCVSPETYAVANGHAWSCKIASMTYLVSLIEYMIVIVGIITAMKVIAQKYLIQQTDVVTLQFWNSLGGTIISAVCMAIPGQLGTLPKGQNTLADWLLLLTHAFSTGIAMLLLYKSQQMISAILYGLTTSVNVVFMLIAQYTVLSHIQAGHKNAEEYSGAILVIFSAVLVPLCSIVKEKFFPYQQIEEATHLKDASPTLKNGYDAFDWIWWQHFLGDMLPTTAFFI